VEDLILPVLDSSGRFVLALAISTSRTGLQFAVCQAKVPVNWEQEVVLLT
jgi:hypothetical protein